MNLVKNMSEHSCHLSDKIYRFSENLPRSQALLENQLSCITWRDTIFLFQDVHNSSIVMLFCSLAPRYLAEAPSIRFSDRFGGGRLLCGKIKG
jgi:hypothetical protein